MMSNKYIIAASFAVFCVTLAYFLNFYVRLGFSVSSDVSDWASLGDYAGGLLGPILNFISIVLLVKSLVFQKNANDSMRQEFENSKKLEKLRSFEVLFFNMIESQKSIFESFSISFEDEGRVDIKECSEAVIKLEEVVEFHRDEGFPDAAVAKFLDEIDSNDRIFSLLRSFYVSVKAVTERLSDQEGFGLDDRKAHFTTLINFTDFSHFRLLLMAVQFMDCVPASYIRENQEFREVVNELDCSMDIY